MRSRSARPTRSRRRIRRRPNLLLDPPYTPSFDGRTAPFEFSDFAFDSHNELRRHYATYQADWRLPTTGARPGTHVETAARRLGRRARRCSTDGWRTRRPTPRATTSAGRCSIRRCGRACSSTGGLRVEHNDSFGTAVVPRGVGRVHRAPGSRARSATPGCKASAGKGIKEPTLLQSFSTSPFFLGNPDLEPERSTQRRTSASSSGSPPIAARVELTWFGSRYRNIISTRTISFDPFTSQYFNIGLTRARGAELSGERRAGCRRAGAGRLHASGLEDHREHVVVQPGVPAGPVAVPPPAALRVSPASRSPGARFTADLAGVFVGRRVDSDFSSLEPPLLSNDGYATWDCRRRVSAAPARCRSPSRWTIWLTPTTWIRSATWRSAAPSASARRSGF